MNRATGAEFSTADESWCCDVQVLVEPNVSLYISFFHSFHHITLFFTLEPVLELVLWIRLDSNS